MANVDFPSGLRPIRNQGGSSPQVIAMDSVSTVIYEGALAILSSDGTVSMNGADTVSSTDAVDIVGVFVQSKAASADGADGSRSKVLVNIDPEQLYVIQSDDDTLVSAANFVGRNFAVVEAASGNTTTLRSICELDGSSGASAANTYTTSAEILQVISEYSGKRIDGDLTSNGQFIVKIVPATHIHRNNLGV